jgi:Carboxypeptidase regulatory-like domain
MRNSIAQRPTAPWRRALSPTITAVIVAVSLATIARTAAAQHGAPLVVGVSDIATGSAIADAEVSLIGIRRMARSNGAGEALLVDVPAGTYEIRVRRLGYAAASVRFAMGPDSARVSIMLKESAAGLDTVHIVASAITTERHRQFDARMRRGLGRFLGPDALERSSFLDFPIVAIQHFPGLALITGRGGQWQLASRHGSCGVDTTYETLSSTGSLIRGEAMGSRMTGAGSGARQTVADAATSQSSCFSDHPCHVKLFLDDQPVAETDINIVHTSELYGVEYYATGNAPPRYQVSGAACGIILLWTKAGNSG